jgi:hypothetical protein
MPNYRNVARSLLAGNGGVGAVQILAQQPGGVGQPVMIMPQQPGGVGLPAQMAQPGGQVQGDVSYLPAGYRSGGLTYCGFPRVVVPAGAVGQTIQVNVRRPFLPQLAYLPSTEFGLIIQDFDVEGTGLFANPANQGVPNETLSEVSNIEQIQWPTLDPSTGGAFLVSNPTIADIIFSGTFWGTNLIRS